MAEKTAYTFSEAASLWELNRDEGFQGLMLIVDLDQANAGLCLCRQGELPRLLWEESGMLDPSWFPKALTELWEDCPPETADALLQQATNRKWVLGQQAFFRNRKQDDMPLPPLTVAGRQLTLSCKALDQLLIHHWDEAISRVLQQAKKQMDSQDKNLVRRILPVGALSKLFLAEYRLRETFLDWPLVPSLLIRTWGEGEDPARVVEEGRELLQKQVEASQVLPFTLRLQTQGLVEDRLEPMLLTLAEKGTPYAHFQEVTYVGPIVIGPNDHLVLFADSDMHRIDPGFLRFGPDKPFRCLEAGLGLYQEKLSLFLQDNGQTKAWINLDIH